MKRKDLYIAALQAAIKYNESFFDAHWDGRSVGMKRNRQLKKSMGAEFYNEWVQETKAFEKELKRLNAKHG